MHRARYAARNLVGTYRPLVGLLALRPGGRQNPLRRDTEVCVEGFPRSGNSFATVLLRRRGVQHITSHRHAPGHVRRALARDVPVVLLVRDPAQACASQLVGTPRLRADDVLRAYQRFHANLWPLRDRLLVVSFETLTGDTSTVLRAVVRHTGLQLRTEAVSDDERTEVFHQLKWLSELDPRQGPDMAARPARDREVRKEAVAGQVRSSQLLPAARAWWTRWRDLAV